MPLKSSTDVLETNRNAIKNLLLADERQSTEHSD